MSFFERAKAAASDLAAKALFLVGMTPSAFAVIRHRSPLRVQRLAAYRREVLTRAVASGIPGSRGASIGVVAPGRHRSERRRTAAGGIKAESQPCTGDTQYCSTLESIKAMSSPGTLDGLFSELQLSGA